MISILRVLIKCRTIVKNVRQKKILLCNEMLFDKLQAIFSQQEQHFAFKIFL